MLLEECKYIVKESRIHKYVIGNLEISFDEENCNKGSSDQENYI